MNTFKFSATTLKTFAISFTFTALVPWARSQAAPAPAAAPPPPTSAVSTEQPIAIDSEEVSLDLVVRRKNKPVLDLTAQELAVTDDGKPVKISSMRLVNGAQDSDHLVTIVFDRMDQSAAKNSHQIAEKVLKLIPQTGFSIAVLRVDGRLKLLQQYTSDRREISKAMALATESEDTANPSEYPEKNLMAMAQTGADTTGAAVSMQDHTRAQAMLATLQESQRVVQDKRGIQSLSCLLALARTQRQFSGRKVVIFFAQGLQGDTDTADMVQSVNGAANRSGVSIYTIDANAIDSKSTQNLMVAMAMGGVATAARLNPAPTGIATPQDMTTAGMTTAAANTVGRFENEGLAGTTYALEKLAVGTGGAYIPSGDSLKKPLKRLVEDMTTYYEASYTPPIVDYDGRFRPVAVRPLRKGLTVRTRTGYFALPPSSGTGIRPFEAPLIRLLSAAQLPSDLKFRSSVIRLGNLPDGNAAAAVIEVPLSEIDMHEDPNTRLYNAHLSIVAQIKTKAGLEIEHFSEDIPRHGALEAMQSARSQVVTLQRHFVAPPGPYVLEAAVLDRNSEKAGAQRIDFDIPPPPTGPALSDIALIRRTDALAVDADPTEPLRYKNGRVVPNLSGILPRDAKEISLFFMIHPDAHATDQPTLEMELTKNGETIGRVPLQLRQGIGGSVVPYLGNIQAKSFTPGKYEVTATLTQGGKIAEQSAGFIIEGPDVASVTRTGPATSADAASNGSVSDEKISGVLSRQASRFVITSPANPVPQPSAEELQAILDGARDRAQRYGDSLPNFSCVEITNRSVDHASTGRWKHRDTIAQLLRYSDHAETRLTLSVNGETSSKSQTDLKGAVSNGEFGGLLNAVFAQSSKAEFTWKETGNLDGGLVQVFDYKVAQANSSFGLTGNNNWMLTVGFHGEVFIDNATRSVRRVTLIADETPKDFFIRGTVITVDYDYVAINAHDYLMPARGTVSLRQGKREAVLNEIEFRDYKRFGSKSRILGFTPAAKEN